MSKKKNTNAILYNYITHTYSENIYVVHFIDNTDTSKYDSVLNRIFRFFSFFFFLPFALVQLSLSVNLTVKWLLCKTFMHRWYDHKMAT